MGGADNENAVLISILDAEVVDVRVTTTKDGVPRTEFKLIIWTDRRGQLSVWHKSKTFLNLSTTLTIQQLHQGLPPFDYPSYDAPTMDQINAFLRQAMASSLEWGIRVDADTVVYKINKTPDASPHRSSSSVVNHDSSVVSHDEPPSTAEMSLLKASIVDFRIQTVHAGTNDERECVQYCVVIETAAHGTLQVWRRYSTFRDLANSLELHDALPPSPLLPSQLTGGMISQRVAQLNRFLETATTEPSLEWGIRIDKDSCVFKRATKPPADTADQHLSHFQLMQAPPPEDHQVSLISVAVKGYRLSGKNAQGQCSIKYNAQLECLSNIHGLCTYSIWRRYGTFHELEKSLNLTGSPRLSDPGDPVHHDKNLIDQRIRKLNRFLDYISHTDDLEWGIRVDAETIVYKRRVV